MANLSAIIAPTNVVTTTGTQTLTNKTLTGAIVNGTVGATTPSTVGATTVTASNTGAVATFTTTQTSGNAVTINVDGSSGTPVGLRIAAGFATIGSTAKLINVVDSAGGNLFNVQANGVIGIGQGIAFPATASLSTNANTLDDYEEGTWSVVDNSGAGLSITVNASKYIKIGKMVYAFADVTFPSTASTASVNLSLPFAPDPQYAQMGAPIRNNKSLTCNPFTVPDSGGGIIFLKSAFYTDYQTNANMTSGTCQFSITYSSAN